MSNAASETLDGSLAASAGASRDKGQIIDPNGLDPVSYTHLHELVAAQAEPVIVGTEFASYGVRGRADQVISLGMAMKIVHILQPVDVV